MNEKSNFSILCEIMIFPTSFRHCECVCWRWQSVAVRRNASAQMYRQ